MILRSLRVESWRCFVDAIEIPSLSERLNVLHAPNGSGKSTLFEALVRGLLDSHTVSGRDAEQWVPWGRKLAPSVRVGFAHAGHEYEITKRFLERPMSELRRREPDGSMQLLERGQSADERVRALFVGTAPGRGPSRAEHWGLAQVLWAPQGEMRLNRPTHDVIASIRSSLGSQVAGPSSSALETKIEALYLRAYTPHGRLRQGRDAPELVQLEERRDRAQEALTQARAQFESFERESTTLERLRAQRSEREQSLAARQYALDHARSVAAQWHAVQTERAQSSAREQANRTLYNTLRAQEEKRVQCREELTRVHATLERDTSLEAELTAREAQAEEEFQLLLQQERALQTRTEQLRDIEKQLTEISALDKDIARAEKHLESIRAAQQALDALSHERPAGFSPAGGVVERVRHALHAFELAQTRIAVHAVRANVVALQPIRIAHPSQSVDLASQDEHAWTETPSLTLEIEGIARIHVEPGTQSFAADRNALEQATQTLDGLCNVLQCNRNALEAQAQHIDQHAQRENEARRQLRSLTQAADATAMERSLAMLQGRRSVHWQTAVSLSRGPDELSALEAWVSTEREVCASLRTRFESRREPLRRVLLEVAAQRASVTTRRESMTARKTALELERIELEREGLASDERESRLRTAAMEADTAHARVQQLDAHLSTLDAHVVAQCAVLEAEQRHDQDQVREALAQEKIAEGRLEQLAAQGTYSAVARLEEELARLDTERTREQLRTHAISALYRTMEQCRTEAVSAVSQPVEAAAARKLSHLATTLGALRLGEGFEPTSVRNSANTDVRLEALSGGEREQIHFATRLALAEVLATHERQLVVLDDALTFTDSQRLARACELLEQSAERVQVLVITCHPERYQTLRDATFIDLRARMKTVTPTP